VKLLLPDSVLGPETFADFEPGPPGRAGDLLVHLGGAVSSREYAARRESRPDALLDLLAAAGHPCAALLLSYPPGLPGRPEAAAEPFLRHFRDELLPRLPAEPEHFAVLGYSLGAALGVLLARSEGQRLARLATVGAVGAAEALILGAPPLGPLTCAVRVAWNAEDPCSPHSLRFVAALEAAGIPLDVQTGAGGHAFPQYVASGLLPAALAFAAEGLRPA
jgi:pimeloyl-ACP methyl ester carboxylesterase